MECPKCGYMMDDFTTECPRCARLGAKAVDPPQGIPTPAPAQIPVPTLPRPAYGTPYGYENDMQARNSGLAIASLVTGLAGLCTCGVSSVVGLVLGIIAMMQINNDPRRLKGSGLAISGIIVSALIVIGAIGMFASGASFMRRFMQTPSGKSSMTISLQQQINTGLMKFHLATGVYPDDLNDLAATSEKDVTTKIPAGTFHGPYVMAIDTLGMKPIKYSRFPANPLVDANDADITHHWVYNKEAGTVVSAVEPPALDPAMRRHRMGRHRMSPGADSGSDTP